MKLWHKIFIGTLLLAQGKKGVYLGMLSASVAVNILCNTITIPLWGKMGAAVAHLSPERNRSGRRPNTAWWPPPCKTP